MIRKLSALWGLLLLVGPMGGAASEAQQEAAPGAADLVVILVPQGLAEEPVEATLEVRAGGDAEEVLRRPVSVPGTLELSDVGEFPWRIRARAEGTWSRPVEVTAPPATAIRLPVWPSTRLRATIRPLGEEPMPESIGLRLQEPSGTTGGFELGEVNQVCPVGAEGELDCALPAVPLDLRLRVPGFASRFFWNQDLTGKAELDLGTVDLRPGASLIGRVEVPAGYEVSAVEARMDASQAMPVPQEANPFRDVEVSVDERGFFALEGLQPGLYRLRLTHPELAPTQVEPVTVVEGSQTEIDRALTLDLPATLRWPRSGWRGGSPSGMIPSSPS